MDKNVYLQTSANDSMVLSVLKRLHLLTNRLRILGITVSVLTAITFILSMPIFQDKHSYRDMESMIRFFFIVCFSVNFLLLLLYDRFRKRGDAYFEEISDELQWDLKLSKKSDSNLERKRPDIEARVILREYINVTDLPLVRGRNGITIYALVNIFSLIIFFFTSFLYYRNFGDY
jgi:hypothetical protein